MVHSGAAQLCDEVLLLWRTRVWVFISNQMNQWLFYGTTLNIPLAMPERHWLLSCSSRSGATIMPAPILHKMQKGSRDCWYEDCQTCPCWICPWTLAQSNIVMPHPGSDPKSLHQLECVSQHQYVCGHHQQCPCPFGLLSNTADQVGHDQSLKRLEGYHWGRWDCLPKYCSQRWAGSCGLQQWCDAWIPFHNWGNEAS